ncbi:MAG: ferrous iron transporter B [Deltaproteobacteria bacterium]|nr:ferrous iron transporter B [Deltaproteobacteria bacterium]
MVRVLPASDLPAVGASHGRGPASTAGAPRAALAVVGNVNVGKTTLTARLGDGGLAKVPGAATARRVGAVPAAPVDFVDTPGTCSRFAPNEDARAVSAALLAPALRQPGGGVLVVGDAKHLKRSLALLLQCAEHGLPTLFVLNMSDEAAARGISLDLARLRALLGIDVCAVVATEGLGVAEVRARLRAMRVPRKLARHSAPTEEYLELAARLLCDLDVPPGPLALGALTSDPAAEQLIRRGCGPAMLEQLRSLAGQFRLQEPAAVAAELAGSYNLAAEGVVRDARLRQDFSHGSFAESLGRLCTRLATGVPIAVAVAVLMFLFVGRFGAGFLVDHIKGGLLEGVVLPLLQRALQHLPSAFVRDLLLDRHFGLIASGVFLPLGLVLPVLFCFYLFFGLLEESGYLPRLSCLCNGVLRRVGLNGKGLIPLSLGFSCITLATLATRTLDTPRERNIATILLLLGIPCSPLLAVMLTVLRPLPASASLTVIGLIVAQVVLAGVLAHRFLPGRPTPLLMELAPMRLPRPWPLLRRALSRTFAFLREALPFFVLAALVMFLVARSGGLQLLERACRPVVHGLMGLPEESVQVFLKALIRRETGAAELVQLRPTFSNAQLVAVTFLMTFAVPCINTVMVLLRERGVRTALAIVGAVMVYAALIGGLLHHVCRILGVTFA